MTIKIITEKIRGEQLSFPYKNNLRYRRIISISGIFFRDVLPKEYLNSKKESCYGLIQDKHLLVFQGDGVLLLSPHLLYPENSFQEALQYIKIAGENLHQIKKNWQGKETFYI